MILCFIFLFISFNHRGENDEDDDDEEYVETNEEEDEEEEYEEEEEEEETEETETNQKEARKAQEPQIITNEFEGKNEEEINFLNSTQEINSSQNEEMNHLFNDNSVFADFQVSDDSDHFGLSDFERFMS